MSPEEWGLRKTNSSSSTAIARITEDIGRDIISQLHKKASSFISFHRQ
jgi:hypothetical protein